jgi:hypothetical protein
MNRARKTGNRCLRPFLQVEQLESRIAPAAAIALAPVAIPVSQAIAEGTAAAGAFSTAAAASGGAAAGPPALAYLLGQAAGAAKGLANAVTQNLKSEGITAASQQSQSAGDAAANLAKAVALSVATQAKQFLDFADATADGLLADAENAPSVPNSYLALVAASYKAGQGESTLIIDEGNLAVDSVKSATDPSPENQKQVVEDQKNLVADIKHNVTVDLANDFDNAAKDGLEAGKAGEALNAAFAALLQALFSPNPPSFNQPPPTVSPTPFPQPTPRPPTTLNFSGSFSGRFTSTGDDDNGRGFFSSALSGPARLTVTASPGGGFDVSGRVNITQAIPDTNGPDNFSGSYDFGFHVTSLSQRVSFFAPGSDGSFQGTGSFGNGVFSGTWNLIGPSGDTSDTGSGTFSLRQS